MLNVDRATALRHTLTPVLVLQREVLWSGGTISIRVPLDAREGKAPLPEGALKYVQFAHCVRGGVVNFFVHGKNPVEFRGKRISARVTILKKTLPGNREYVYVDLLPIQDTARPTHRLAVMSGGQKVMEQEGQLLFMTPQPMRGVIALALAGNKILTTD